MVASLTLALAALVYSATTQTHYYAHDAIEDGHGVIAPWYTGQNGQFDYRVRIAAETLKRYPWAEPAEAMGAGPEYIYNGTWKIDVSGNISVPPLRDWDNGDLGQRAAYLLSSLTDYYRYSGDAASISIISLLANYLLCCCQTPGDHPWPDFLVSVPTKGAPYGICNPEGMIQLDIVAETGLALLRAYQLTGSAEWFEACRHWGDLLAKNRDQTPGMPPWNRYANPENAPWDDHMTGGVVYLLAFFDELIRLGYTGDAGAIVEARDAGRIYLRDTLLPRWTVDDTWGRNYWDWWDSVQSETVTDLAARYMMENPTVFPNWKQDVRNILLLFLNRTGVSPASSGDVFSGAWAYPESSGCCKRSLWYAPMQLAPPMAQYGALANDPLLAEIARRQQLLATYDFNDVGIVEDDIDGGFVVAGSWFKITHPMALKHVLGTMAWLPQAEGPSRENHLMRSSAVVNSVLYGDGRIEYTTFDAPENTVEVLRLAFSPEGVSADGEALAQRDNLARPGYTLNKIEGGDYLIGVRHDGRLRVVIEGSDPQEFVPAAGMRAEGAWAPDPGFAPHNGESLVADAPNATLACSFRGNQVRVIGRMDTGGGIADVYLDDEKQIVPVDCWGPSRRDSQVLYWKNGLENGEHSIKIVARGDKRPVASAAKVYVEGLQWSAAVGKSDYGQDGGPTEAQRMIFGYPERNDYRDSSGSLWRPATEWVVRLGHLEDVVQRAWWTQRRRLYIAATDDPELYRYGAHAPEFWANLTVNPGEFYVRLKFAETRDIEPKLRAVTIAINGDTVATDIDLAATAGGLNRAVDLVFSGIKPKHGIIEVRFSNTHGGEAMVQALELGPSHGGQGVEPVGLTTPTK